MGDSIKKNSGEGAPRRHSLQQALIALTPLRDLAAAAAQLAEAAALWSGADMAYCRVLAGNNPEQPLHWLLRSFPESAPPVALPSQLQESLKVSEGGRQVLTLPVPFDQAGAKRVPGAILQMQFGESDLPSEGDLAIFIAQAGAALANARAFEAQKRASRGWECTFDGMIDGLAIERSDGRISRVNRALCALLGLEAEAVIGRRREDVFPSLPGYQLVQPLHRAANTAAGLPAHQGEFCVGTPARILAQTVFPLNESGRPDAPAGSVCVLRDVTESRRLQEQSTQSEKLAALGELISGVAHELNNPLTAVIGYAQLLEGDDSLPDSLRRPMQTIQTEATRASRIVGNLLAFARREEAKRVPLNVNDVVRAVVEIRAYQLRAQNTEIIVRYGEGLPQICGDSHQLQQVLLNIINNAHQALQEWRQGGQITVTTSFTASRQVRIVIADNGPGIAEEHLNKVFDPFWTTKPLGQGTGLGMSISLAAISDHNGRLWAESQPGRGAQFYIELPPAEGQEAGAETLAEVGSAAGSAGEYSEGAQILVIDDEEPVVTLITEVLRLDGHEVTPAFNGAEALALLQQRSFDLILSDVRMPAVGGPTFFEILQTTHPQLLPRVIFVTGDTVSPSTQDFLRRAARPLLSKPFAPDRLRQLVNEHLEK